MIKESGILIRQLRWVSSLEPFFCPRTQKFSGQLVRMATKLMQISGCLPPDNIAQYRPSICRYSSMFLLRMHQAAPDILCRICDCITFILLRCYFCGHTINLDATFHAIYAIYDITVILIRRTFLHVNLNNRDHHPLPLLFSPLLLLALIDHIH